MRNDGGPAFSTIMVLPPAKAGEFVSAATASGMSRRDLFAAFALAGYRAARSFHAGAYPSESQLWSPGEVAREAYRDADAMLREGEKSAQ